MKILFAVSEGVPYVKSGGLADVVGSLPKALAKKGNDVRIVMPLYSAISEEHKKEMQFIKAISVSLSWRQQYCGIKVAVHDDITYYFIDNEYYFKRNTLYGQYDDGERFAFFSKAVLEIIQYIDFVPEVIHCHDWQSALVPLFLKAFYTNLEQYKPIKTVLTIHNLQYQGVYPYEIATEVLGLPTHWNCLKFDHCANYLKAGIECCDMLTTVSPTYAKEITTLEYGHYLDGTIRYFSYKLRGIVNGIDVGEYNPNADKILFKTFNRARLSAKTENKNDILEHLGLAPTQTAPVISMVTRLVDHKGLDIVIEKLEQMLWEDIRFIVLGTGDFKYEKILLEMAIKYPGKLSVNIMFNSDLAKRIYAGSDIFLMPSHSEPCGLAQMISMRYGTIPIVHETGGLKDTVVPFNEFTGEGNGFSFCNYNSDELMKTFKYALENYYNKENWEKLMQNAMSTDFSFKKSAQEYIEIYKEILAK